MKLRQDKDHNIICYSVGGYNFLTEEDANNFLSYVKWENVKVREIIYCIGIPNIINWQLSLKKGYRIDLRKVKGHAGQKWNEMADGLATGRIQPIK